MLRSTSWFTILTAVSLINIGVITLITRLLIYDLMISSIFVLSPNSFLYESWRKPPVTLVTHFYLFNWTNPEEIYNLTSKPRLEQHGPYMFIADIEKVNITWNENGTVSYRLLQRYYFDDKNSNGSLDDVITSLNTVTVSAAHKLRYDSYWKKSAFSYSLDLFSSGIHISKTARELFFDGYQDLYVDISNMFPFLSDNFPNIDRVGYLFGRNNSYTIDGVYTVGTSSQEILGQIIQWNYEKKIPHYRGSCAELGGSMGDFFSLKKSRDFIKMFLADTCRNYKLDFEKETTVEGILGFKYSARHSVFDNGTFVPENKCYCGGKCVPSGTVNLTACTYGAPTFLSLPHFYGADPYYINKIEGLKPEKSKHEYFITVEPNIGVCIDLGLRIQINFLLHPVEDITLFENVPEVYLPMLWSEQRVTVPREFAFFIRIILAVPNVILPVIGVSCVLIGLLIIVFKLRQPKKQYKSVVDSNQEETQEWLPLQNKEKCYTEIKQIDNKIKR